MQTDGLQSAWYQFPSTIPKHAGLVGLQTELYESEGDTFTPLRWKVGKMIMDKWMKLGFDFFHIYTF